MRRPSTPLKIIGVISRYWMGTQMKTSLPIARTVAARTVSRGCQWRAAGTMSPTVQTSSRMPRAIQTSRGNAPKDGPPSLTRSEERRVALPICQPRLPMEGGGDDEPDCADEFEDAEGHPDFPRQRTKGRDPLAYLVEHKDIHDARSEEHTSEL